MGLRPVILTLPLVFRMITSSMREMFHIMGLRPVILTLPLVFRMITSSMREMFHIMGLRPCHPDATSSMSGKHQQFRDVYPTTG